MLPLVGEFHLLCLVQEIGKEDMRLKRGKGGPPFWSRFDVLSVLSLPVPPDREGSVNSGTDLSFAGWRVQLSKQEVRSRMDPPCVLGRGRINREGGKSAFSDGRYHGTFPCTRGLSSCSPGNKQ